MTYVNIYIIRCLTNLDIYMCAYNLKLIIGNKFYMINNYFIMSDY